MLLRCVRPPEQVQGATHVGHRVGHQRTRLCGLMRVAGFACGDRGRTRLGGQNLWWCIGSVVGGASDRVGSRHDRQGGHLGVLALCRQTPRPSFGLLQGSRWQVRSSRCSARQLIPTRQRLASQLSLTSRTSPRPSLLHAGKGAADAEGEWDTKSHCRNRVSQRVCCRHRAGHRLVPDVHRSARPVPNSPAWLCFRLLHEAPGSLISLPSQPSRSPACTQSPGRRGLGCLSRRKCLASRTLSVCVRQLRVADAVHIAVCTLLLVDVPVRPTTVQYRLFAVVESHFGDIYIVGVFARISRRADFLDCCVCLFRVDLST